MTIQTRNNVNIVSDAGPVLLYAHGFGCNQTMWNRITPHFAASHRQVLFDYVGSGKSDSAAFNRQRYSSLEGYAQDMLDVCDALDLREGVTLVAHSVSCSVGFLSSIARPGLFDRLILVGPSPCFLNDPPDYLGGFERADLEELLSLMEQNYIGWANYLAPVVSGEAATATVTSELSDSFCSTDPVMARVFVKATFFADNRADLPLVPCPSLILQHRDDALVPPAVAAYMHAHLRESTLQVIDVKGHCGHMSHPTLVADAMRAYLSQPVARPKF